jgi:hypothetical protein
MLARELLAPAEKPSELRAERRGGRVVARHDGSIITFFAAAARNNDRAVRRAVSLLIFALLEGLWAVLVGTQQDTELVPA